MLMVFPRWVPGGEEAPVDLFDERDGALALQVARGVVDFADQQLGALAQPESSQGAPPVAFPGDMEITGRGWSLSRP